VNRGSPGGPLAASSDAPDVASVLTDPAYASGFEAVATLAGSGSDPALRDAAATLQTSVQPTANDGSVDPATLRDAMSTLTRRCLELGFPVPPVSSR
jgi:hypothetical protein